MYADARRRSADDPVGALADFRRTRDALFATHPESPIPAPARGAFHGLAYWPHDPALRFEVEVDTRIERLRIPMPMSRDEPVIAERCGRVRLPFCELDEFWLSLYGGGLFLPFRDRSAGVTTYGGGRYLLDTIKGADLGGDGTRLVLDFNYAYHPSCSYDSVWSCPLAPKENALPVAIEAGERL
jgi:uncharacterized protein (DUF1684 family)